MSQTGSYKTIKYTLFDSQSPNLIVILPAASNFDPASFKDLINGLTKISKVLFISSGYYGLPILDSVFMFKDYSIDSFNKILNELITNLKVNKVSILAVSGGCIHAIDYCINHTSKVNFIVLGAPALCKPKFINNLLDRFVVDICVLYPDATLNIFIKCLGIIPSCKSLAKQMTIVKNIIGARSYLYCLREIVLFAKNKKQIAKILKERAIVLLGIEDYIFKRLCDEDLCKKSLACVYVSSTHAVMSEVWKDILKIVEERVAASN